MIGFFNYDSVFVIGVINFFILALKFCNWYWCKWEMVR